MDQIIDPDPFRPFHDRDSDDIYDLYNACNGAISDGMLDVRKLDELTKEEREVLNVQRLRELWTHIASGCTRCETIITTLNISRETMREHRAVAGQKPRVFTIQR